MLVALSHSRLNPEGAVSALTMIHPQDEILISLQLELYLLSAK